MKNSLTEIVDVDVNSSGLQGLRVSIVYVCFSKIADYLSKYTREFGSFESRRGWLENPTTDCFGFAVE